MKIGSLCRRQVVTIDAAGTLAQAATLMRDQHVGALVVTARTPEGLHASGIVTDRDLVIDALARGFAGSDITIGDLASERIVSIGETQDVDQTIALMRETGVRRLLVLDAERRVTGIVSLDDLIEVFASQLDDLSKVLRSGFAREVAETASPPPQAPLLLRFPAMGNTSWTAAAAAAASA